MPARALRRFRENRTRLAGLLATVAAAGLAMLGSAPPALAQTGTTQLKVAVLLVNFQDVPHPTTPAAARQRIFTSPDSTNAFYKEMTQNRLSLVGNDRPDGDVLGPYTVPFSKPCEGGNTPWRAEARALAETDGHDLDNYDYIVYAGPMACGSALGFSRIPSSWVSVYGDIISQVVAHELGHAIGLEHAASTTCTNSDGEWTAYSHDARNCTTDDTGDGASVMSVAQFYQFTNWEKARLAERLGVPVLGPTTTVTAASGWYFLAPSEPGFNSATQTLRIPFGNGYYYYLDYRQPYGVFDDFALGVGETSGVSIRVAPDPSPDPIKLAQPRRLGLMPFDIPGSSTLTVGATFRDEQLGIRVTTLAVAPFGALLEIHTAPPASVPVRVGTSSSQVNVDGGEGNASDLTISRSGPDYTISDANNPIQPLAGCAGETSNSVKCTLSSSANRVVVDAGDGDDRVQIETTILNPVLATVFGGSGNDELIGSGDQYRDDLYGGSGSDQLDGRDGKDHLYGGAGDDILDGGTDADTIRGGEGKDLVDYSSRSQDLNVSIGDGPNDGDRTDGISTKDRIESDVEGVIGGSGNDVLTGDASDNELIGGSGDDTLNGGAGNDTLDGGPDADTLSGGSGFDTATYYGSPAGVNVSLDNVANDGMSGEGDSVGVDYDIEYVDGSHYWDDVLSGNGLTNLLRGFGGDDKLFGGGGSDVLFGGAHKDTLLGQGGPDWIWGESGDDFLYGLGGNDILVGGPGADTMSDNYGAFKGSGDDLFYAYEEPATKDSVKYCGDDTDNDTVIRDTADVQWLWPGCEDISLGP